MDHLTEQHSYDRLSALSANIRQGKVNGSCKHSRLLGCGNNYGSKKIYGSDPWLAILYNFLRSQFKDFCNKRECLYLASLSSLV